MNIRSTSLYVLLATALPVHAENLGPYRNAQVAAKSFPGVTERGDFQKLALQRTALLRELLNSKANEIKWPANLPYPTEKNRPTRPFTSSYFRSALSRAAQALMEKETLGQPRVFDPSKQLYELNEDLWNSRREVFVAEVLKKDAGGQSAFDRLVDVMHFESISAELATPAAENTPTELEVKVAEHLKKWIAEQQPFPKVQEGAAEIQVQPLEVQLGNLQRVEISEGYVTRLIFMKGEERMPLHTSMVAHVRSGLDKYFVIMFGFFHEELESQLAASYERDEKDGSFLKDEQGNRILRDKSEKNRERVMRLEKVESFISKRFEDAVRVNKGLLNLHLSQLTFLMDLLLQLRGEDVPVQGEMGALKELVAPEMTEVLEKNRSEKTPITRLPKLGLDLEALQNDLVFYDDMDDQLNKLQLQLELEKGRRQ